MLIRSKGSQEDINKKTATAESGINRSLERKLFPFYCNPLSSVLLRTILYIQTLFYDTDLGNGYIVVAGNKERY